MTIDGVSDGIPFQIGSRISRWLQESVCVIGPVARP
jgi:hypothetical protein